MCIHIRLQIEIDGMIYRSFSHLIHVCFRRQIYIIIYIIFKDAGNLCLDLFHITVPDRNGIPNGQIIPGCQSTVDNRLILARICDLLILTVVKIHIFVRMLRFLHNNQINALNAIGLYQIPACLTDKIIVLHIFV